MKKYIFLVSVFLGIVVSLQYSRDFAVEIAIQDQINKSDKIYKGVILGVLSSTIWKDPVNAVKGKKDQLSRWFNSYDPDRPIDYLSIVVDNETIATSQQQMMGEEIPLKFTRTEKQYKTINTLDIFDNRVKLLIVYPVHSFDFLREIGNRVFFTVNLVIFLITATIFLYFIRKDRKRLHALEKRDETLLPKNDILKDRLSKLLKVGLEQDETIKTQNEQITAQRKALHNTTKRLKEVNQQQEQLVFDLAHDVPLDIKKQSKSVINVPDRIEDLAKFFSADVNFQLNELEKGVNRLVMATDGILNREQQLEFLKKEQMGVSTNKKLMRIFEQKRFDINRLKVPRLQFEKGKQIRTVVYDKNFKQLIKFRKALTKNDDFQIVDVRSTVDDLELSEVQLVLFDLNVAETHLEALQAVQDIRIMYPYLPIIVLSGYVEPEVVFTSFLAGARSHLSKMEDLEDLVYQLDRVVFKNEVIIGGIFATAFLTLFMIREHLNQTPAQHLFRALWGDSNHKIAQDFFVTDAAVSQNISKAIRQLGIESGSIAELREVLKRI